VDTKVNLHKDFPLPTWEEWKKVVVDSLKGVDYDKALKTRTYEGITLEPIYRREDIKDISFIKTEPGKAPYVRGNDPQKFIDEGWKIAQAQTNPDLKALNANLKEELMRGLAMVNLKLKHVDYPAGIKLKSVKDLHIALDGIDLKAAPLFIQMDSDDEDIFALLLDYLEKQKLSARDLEGFIGYDVTGEFARKGYFDMSLEEVWQKIMDVVIQRANRAPKMRAFIIDGCVYEHAGASSTMELAFVLSTAIGYIQGLLQTGMDINTIAPLFAVKLSLGSNFFMEIAKIRSFRLLWAEMIKAFGGNEESQKIWIHGKTAAFNKSTYDLYVNMLRTTTESFSGVIGGVDSLETDPFDAVVKDDNAFSRRIARNQQLILAEESHFTKVVDPAGGCYYIESLTAQLAEAAWKIMQEIEKDGGMIRSLRTGKIHDMIAKIAQTRIEAVHKRRDVFVGVNMYANPTDEALSEISIPEVDIQSKPVWLEKGALPRLRAVQQVEELRAQISTKAPKIMLLNIGSVAEYKARADFSSGFFQMAGYDVLGDMAFNTVPEAIIAAKDSHADAFCICSTDAKYEEIVAPLCKELKPSILILAGYPADKVEEYKEHGIDLFIHIRANAYDTLKDLARKLEVI
jgi:methylmalonyl-CoA mutase